MAMLAPRSPGWGLPAGYRPGRLLLIAIMFLAVGGCESDREELEASNSCVWCRLNGADLAGVDLAGATLWMTFLERADLQGAVLKGANINRVKFTGANLTQADLSGADARKTVFTHADLSGADLTDAQSNPGAITPNGASSMGCSCMVTSIGGTTNLFEDSERIHWL